MTEASALDDASPRVLLWTIELPVRAVLTPPTTARVKVFAGRSEGARSGLTVELDNRALEVPFELAGGEPEQAVRARARTAAVEALQQALEREIIELESVSANAEDLELERITESRMRVLRHGGVDVGSQAHAVFPAAEAVFGELRQAPTDPSARVEGQVDRSASAYLPRSAGAKISASPNPVRSSYLLEPQASAGGATQPGSAYLSGRPVVRSAAAAPRSEEIIQSASGSSSAPPDAAKPGSKAHDVARRLLRCKDLLRGLRA